MLALGLDGVMLVVALDRADAIPMLIEVLSGFQARSGDSYARH
jgi:hypothetical protein